MKTPLFVLALLLPSAAIAQTWTGNGGAISPYWGTSSNWSGGSVPNNVLTSDVVFSSGVAQTTARLDRDISLRSLTFSPGSSVTSFLITSQDVFGILRNRNLVIGSGGITNNIGGGATQTISSVITLVGSTTFTTASGGTLVVAGTTGIYGNPNNSLNLKGFDLTVAGAGNTEFQSAVVGGGSRLIKTGSGTLTLTGSNTYSGGTTLSGGSLLVKGNGSLGAGSVSSSRTTALSFLDSSSAINTNINNNGDLSFFNSATAANATIYNDSKLSFSNASTAASATINNEGNLYFYNSSSAGNSTISTTRSTGYLYFSDSSTASRATINVNTGGSLSFMGSATAASATINNTGSLTFSDLATPGSAIINNNAGGTLTFAGTTTVASATINNQGNLTFSDSSSAARANINNDGNLSFYSSSTAADSAIYNDSNISFSNASTAANATIDNEANLYFYNSSSAGNSTINTKRSTGSIYFSDASTASKATVNINAGGALTFSGSATAGSATINNSSAVTFSGLATAGNAIVNNSNALTFAGLATAGSAVLNNNTGGTVSFTETATAARATINNSGTLSFSGTSTASNTFVNNNDTGQVDLANYTGASGLTIGSLSGAGNVGLGARKLTLGTMNNNDTISGVISGTGSLVKTGTGTLTLAGENTYTGATEVNQGILSLTTSKSSIFRATAGTLNLNGLSPQSAFTQFIAGASGRISYNNLTLVGGFLYGPGFHALNNTTLLGTTVFSGAKLDIGQNSSLQAVQLNGTLRVLGTELSWFGGSLGSSGLLSVGAGRTITLDSVDLNGTTAIAPGGAVQNVAGSSLTLGAGSKTYLGGKTNPGGTLDLGGQSLELNGALLINNGTIQNGVVNINYGSLAKGAGSYLGGYSVNEGGNIIFGNSPGTLYSGSSTWGVGSLLTFQIANASGVAGADWGLNDINGTLTLASGTTSASRFTVLLESLLADGNTPGQVANFNPAQSYSWEFVRASGGIVGFDLLSFTLDTSGFENDLGGGSFSLAKQSNGLYIHFTPLTGVSAPEPETLLLLALGLWLGGVVWRQRRLS